MKPTRLLIIGVLLGLVAVVLLNMYVGSVVSSQKKLTFLALSPGVTLVAGQVLEPSMVRTVALPEGFESLMDYAMPASAESYEWLRGRRVTRDVPSGSFLLHEHFFEDDPVERFAATVAPGLRAVTIPVNPRTAVAFFIEPGSRVDVLATMEIEKMVYDEPGASVQTTPDGRQVPSTPKARKEKKIVTRTILQNVKILAVDRATTRGNYLNMGERGFATVTVEVSPLDAEKIVFAIDEAAGELTLVLRNPEDAETPDIDTVGWDSVE